MQTAEQKSAKAITKAVAHCLLVNRGRMNLTILADGTTTLVRFCFSVREDVQMKLCERVTACDSITTWRRPCCFYCSAQTVVNSTGGYH